MFISSQIHNDQRASFAEFMVCTTDIGWRHQCFKGELLTKPAMVFTLCPNLENAASQKTLINQSRWKYDVMGKWNSYGVFRIYSKKVLMTTVSAPPLPRPCGWVYVNLFQMLL